MAPSADPKMLRLPDATPVTFACIPEIEWEMRP
jgi:hypothetical protein